MPFARAHGSESQIYDVIAIATCKGNKMHQVSYTLEMHGCHRSGLAEDLREEVRGKSGDEIGKLREVDGGLVRDTDRYKDCHHTTEPR